MQSQIRKANKQSEGSTIPSFLIDFDQYDYQFDTINRQIQNIVQNWTRAEKFVLFCWNWNKFQEKSTNLYAVLLSDKPHLYPLSESFSTFWFSSVEKITPNTHSKDISCILHLHYLNVLHSNPKLVEGYTDTLITLFIRYDNVQPN